MNDHAITTHYDASGAESALPATVTELIDALPAGPLNAADLAGLDQFHVRGLAATTELAKLADIEPGMAILDAGSGLGGPSRYLAETFGAHVTGVDLTPSFVEVARALAARSGSTAGTVAYEVGSLLALPFPAASFDLVWTQHVVMNVRERERAYAEFRRVLRTGGKVAFYDVIAAGDSLEPYFPVPWSETAATSFLMTKAATIAALEAAGFTCSVWHDVTAESIAALGALSAAPPQPLSLAGVMGPRFGEMTGNLGRSLREGRVALAMGVFPVAP